MEQLNWMEGQILIWIQENLRAAWLTPWMKTITSLGDAGIFWIVMILALLVVSGRQMRRYPIMGDAEQVRMYHWWNRNFQTAIMGVVALSLMFVVTNLILKNMVARIRPYDLIPELENLLSEKDFSFPSGHTAVSFTAGWLFLRRLPKKIGIPSMILAVLIAFSRLYVGVHYPTDVLGGAILGILYAELAMKGVGNALNRARTSYDE